MEETTSQQTAGSASAQSWAERFFINVIWSWVGVLASFFTGFFLSPYIIRSLGDERYGIWALAFAFIDYFALFDFGFKSASVNLMSRFREEKDTASINEVINTSLFYFIAVATGILLFTLAVAGQLHRFFQIAPAYQESFAQLVRIIGFGWAAGVAFSVTLAGLEAFQKFKIQNNIYIVSLIVRSGGSALVLYLGYGLTAMGVVVTCAQFLTYILCFVFLKRTFPEMRISPSLARKAIWKRLVGYGAHAFTAHMGTMLLTQGPVVLVGHFRTSESVGYFSMPNRLLNYVVELITRIGSVTMPNTATLEAQGQRHKVVKFGQFLNRYCLALFLPMAAFLIVFGKNLVTVWITPAFAERAAPLLLPFVLSTTFAVAGQFNSVSILFGLSKHATYSRTLLVEGALALTGMTMVLPLYGVLGAAWVVAGFALVNRGIVTPYLLCRYLKTPFGGYMKNIYLKPLVLFAPIIGVSYGVHQFLVDGRSWPELIVALGLIAIVGYIGVFFLVVEPEHRLLVWSWVEQRLPVGMRKLAAS